MADECGVSCLLGGNRQDESGGGGEGEGKTMAVVRHAGVHRFSAGLFFFGRVHQRLKAHVDKAEK